MAEEKSLSERNRLEMQSFRQGIESLLRKFHAQDLLEKHTNIYYSGVFSFQNQQCSCVFIIPYEYPKKYVAPNPGNRS